MLLHCPDACSLFYTPRICHSTVMCVGRMDCSCVSLLQSVPWQKVFSFYFKLCIDLHFLIQWKTVDWIHSLDYFVRICFSSSVICEGYVLSVAVELMNIERWLKDADRKTGTLRKAWPIVLWPLQMLCRMAWDHTWPITFKRLVT